MAVKREVAVDSLNKPSIITKISALRELSQPWRSSETIAFVPTMGNLHAGHLALVTKAKQLAQRVVVSIFVNPLQFGPNEDLLAYPRTQHADIEQLTAFGVDAVFIPDISELYPKEQPVIKISVADELSNQLCGNSRPGHFNGVATVVTKLFNIVQPQLTIFGEKDFQQLTIIRQMVIDLNFPLEVIGLPTVRETDGLAMSSRNQYLSPAERIDAPQLYATLAWMCDEIRSGNNELANLCARARTRLTQYNFEVDYIEIRTKVGLKIPRGNDGDLIILAAAFLGKTRLIDNISI